MAEYIHLYKISGDMKKVNSLSVGKLHPTVEDFKRFMNARPALVLKLRKNGSSLQDYYDKWIEHGEDDSIWGTDNDEHKEVKTNHAELLDRMIKYSEKIDVNKIQNHVKQLNKALDTVQLLLSDFSSNKNTNANVEKQPQLFNFFRD